MGAPCAYTGCPDTSAASKDINNVLLIAEFLLNGPFPSTALFFEDEYSRAVPHRGNTRFPPRRVAATDAFHFDLLQQSIATGAIRYSVLRR
jgi:hypothetical protein